MDDIEILKLENKALRLQIVALEDENRILKRYRDLIARTTETLKRLIPIGP